MGRSARRHADVPAPRHADRGGRPAVLTIGVYGFDEASFLEELRSAEVPRVLDVRQRRGVRGPEYAWANSRRLQDALATAGIAYQHRRELAPSTELRQLQYAEDDRWGVGKRSRKQLAPEYVRRYMAEILAPADLEPVLRALPAALLCVESDPEACHRSLIAARLADEHGVEVRHLLPRRAPQPPRRSGPPGPWHSW